MPDDVVEHHLPRWENLIVVDRWPWWLQVMFGVLLTAAGVEGLVEDSAVWAKALFLLVLGSGLVNFGYGLRRRWQVEAPRPRK
jgi:hypothetical protein